MAMTRFARVLVLAAALPACTKVVKDTTDPSKPDVVIKVRGSDGQYAPATQTTFHFGAGNELDFMCIVGDPGGVSKAQVTYSSTVDGCTSGSTVSSGVTIYLTGLPDPMLQTLSPDPQGKVLASLPLLGQVKGPLGCYGYSGGIKFTGVPQGDTLVITCSGENWSSNAAARSASKKLTVNLQE
jgi:hypothetical protein